MDSLNIDYWHWWVLAIVLLAVEMFLPGAFFLWMGISAAIVGFALLSFPGLGIEAQLSMFAVLSIATVIVARAYFRRNPLSTDLPVLNRRSSQYVGRVLTLTEPIVNGFGTVKVDDSSWRVQGPDCSGGTVVEVIAADGPVLTVRPKQTAHSA